MMVRQQLPSAPKSILRPDVDLEKVPKKPPFTAYISNISFEADEDKIKVFFKDCKVISVRIAIDGGGRSRGFGHVDFEDRDSLILALGKNEISFNNRPLKVTLDEPPKSKLSISKSILSTSSELILNPKYFSL
jgi:translation initiation factor 4B